VFYVQVACLCYCVENAVYLNTITIRCLDCIKLGVYLTYDFKIIDPKSMEADNEFIDSFSS